MKRNVKFLFEYIYRASTMLSLARVPNALQGGLVGLDRGYSLSRPTTRQLKLYRNINVSEGVRRRIHGTRMRAGRDESGSDTRHSAPSSINRNRLSDQDTSSAQKFHWTRNQVSRKGEKKTGGWDEFWQTLLYQYFLWRRDTWSDLQLFMVINTLLLLLGGVIQGHMMPSGEEDKNGVFYFWNSLYSILKIILGQDLPEETGVAIAEQIFAVAIAVIGLASFALILALIEQVVLEVLEGNVRKGSAVMEDGHYVLLCWGESSRDLNQAIRIVKEICGSHRHTAGGVAIAVLCQGQEKLRMESLFETAVPEHLRYGSRLVFRQGSPLDPLALDLIAAKKAKAVIIAGDYSQRCRESDAQVLRSAVLMDEAVHASSEKPLIIAEMQTEDGLELIKYACSLSVRPIFTTKINTLRTARLLRHPVASVVSHNLFDHNSPCFIGLYHDESQRFAGKSISEIMQYFEYATPLGFGRTDLMEFDLNPDPARVMGKDEQVIILQSVHPSATKALEAPFTSFKSGEDTWDIDVFMANAGKVSTIYQRDPRSLSGRFNSHWGSTSSSDESTTRFFALLENQDRTASCPNVLICGWPGNSYSMALIKALDSKLGLEDGGSVTLLNLHEEAEIDGILKSLRSGLRNITVAHKKCDPRNIHELRNAVDIRDFSAAIVLSDTKWIVDRNVSGFALSSSEMMRMDALILTCQLNIRYLNEETGLSDISIIAEKLSGESKQTRFEDRERLPIGAAINSASFSAKSLAQEALIPGSIEIYSNVDESCALQVQDSSTFAFEGEAISYACLQSRCASLQMILLGYYIIPESAVEKVKLILNPQGAEEKSKRIVWNDGECRCKLVLASKHEHVPMVEKDSDTILNTRVPSKALSHQN